MSDPTPSRAAADDTPAPDAASPPKPASQDPEKPPSWKPAANTRLSIAVFGAAILGGVLLVLAGFRLPPFTSAVQGTDDATVAGLTTDISPEVSGYVWHVPVEDFALVTAGQILVEIDPRTYQQNVKQAQANVEAKTTELANNEQIIAKDQAAIAAQDAQIVSAEAHLAYAQSDLARSSDLVRDGSVSRAEYDRDRASVREAEASIAQVKAGREQAVQQERGSSVNRGSLTAAVEAARAQLGSAQLELERTIIRAPQDGQLSQIGVREGQYVTNGTQLFYLVPRERWVTANFKEAETHRMAIGQSASFTVDALGGQRIHGHISRISPATSAQFSALKPDNATGNFTKVPQRISVRIEIDRDQPLAQRLKPGMSVEAYVDTASGGSPAPRDGAAPAVAAR